MAAHLPTYVARLHTTGKKDSNPGASGRQAFGDELFVELDADGRECEPDLGSVSARTKSNGNEVKIHGMVDIVEKGGTPKAAVQNVEEIVRLEREAARERTWADRVADVVSRLAGTLGFVVTHATLVAVWVIINTGLLPGVPIFDPFPFGFLGSVFSLEGVLLAAFVLIKQSRMSTRADERSHLDLQISLLTEQETTKMIQMLERISRTRGVEDQVMDADAKEMAETTAVGGIAQHLHNNLSGEE